MDRAKLGRVLRACEGMQSARQLVVPAKAGAQACPLQGTGDKRLRFLDSRLRGNDRMSGIAVFSRILSQAPSWVLQIMIRCYQILISPMLPASCRYLPSCSDYTMEAIGRHGALVGLGLALRRLARCHPWGGSGYDPVPVTRGLDRSRPNAGF